MTMVDENQSENGEGEEEQSFDFSSLFAEDGEDSAEEPEGTSEEESPSDAGTPGQQGASEQEDSEQSSTEQTEEESTEQEESADSSESETSTESEEQTGEEQEQAEQPLSEEEYQRQWQETRDQVVSELAGSEEFQISEDEADQLLTEPSKVLPQIMARAHTRMFQDIVRQLSASVPSQVEQTLQRRETVKQDEERFTQNYPELKGNLKTVWGVARTVAQTGDFETREQFERMVAVQSMLKLGKPLPSRFFDGEGNVQEGQESQGQSQPSSEATPHKPSGVGQPDGTSSAGEGRKAGFWESLNQELDEEQEEL